MPLLNTANLRVGAAIVQNAYFGGVDVALGTPSLDLDFTTGALDPRITVTRASTKTYFDINGVMQTASANTLPIEYDPVTLAPKGISIWEARTNLLTYSEQFDNAAWVRNLSTITPNAATAPNGLLVADKIIEAVGTGLHSVAQSSTVATQQYTFAVYAKAAERSVLQLVPNGSFFPSAHVNFNLAAGTVSASSGVDSAAITDVGGGWYRCMFTDTATVAGTGQMVFAALQLDPAATRSLAYAGDGTSGLYLWGAQLEAGAFPTPYIPTPATFTSRASTATYFDAAGVMQTAAINAARNGYGLVGGQWISKGLELEAAATNLQLRSEEFGSAPWVPALTSVTSNAGVAPTGLSTADLITTTAGTGTPRVNSSITSASGTYTYSVFLKKSVGDYAFITLSDASTGQVEVRVNLATGVLDTVNVGPIGSWTNRTRSIYPVGNGWYRVVVSGTQGAGTTVVPQVIVGSAAGERTYTISTPTSVLAWGAQVEAGPIATSYIPTVAATVTRAADISSSAAVTRAADVAVMTGANFTDWYNQTEGTFVTRGSTQSNSASANKTLFAVTDGTVGNRIFGYFNTAAGVRSTVTTAGVSQGETNSGVTAVVGSPVSVALAYKVDDLAISAAGVIAGVDPTVTIPAVSQLGLGNINAATPLNGHISRVTYYPKRVSNAGIKELSV